MGSWVVHPHSRSSSLPYQDQERRTPLHAAAYVGDVPILQLLLMSGESGELEGVVPREGPKGGAYLLYPRMVQLGPGEVLSPSRFPGLILAFLPHLLSNSHQKNVLRPTGANVNAKDTLWLTPLHRAAASRNEGLASPLLSPFRRG